MFDADDPVQRRSAPRIRLVPVRPSSPTYDEIHDDRLDRGRASASSRRARETDGVQGALALDFMLPSGVPTVPTPPRRLRLVGRQASAPLRRPVPDEHRSRRPDPGRWAATIVQAVVEVIAGDRPLSQLVRWTSAEVYEQLAWRRRSAASRLGEIGGSRRSVVLSVHVYQPTDDAVEACAVVSRQGRVAAMALRLEADADMWRCTALRMR